MTEQAPIQAVEPPPPPTPRRGSRSASRRARWSAAAVVVALGLGVVVSEALEWRYLKQPLQTAAQRATGLPVRIDGEFRARLLRGPMLSMQRLTVPSLGFPGLEHLVDATDVRLHWRWWDLWRRAAFGAPLHLQSLQVATLDAQLIRDGDGNTSWQQPGSAQEGALPRFGLLAIEQGHIRWTDAPLATHIDLVVQGADGGQQSGYTVKATGLVRSLPLNLDIVAGGMMALLRDDADDAAAAPMALRIDGKAGRSTLHFEGTATALLDARRLSGAFSFAGPSLAAVGDPLGLVLPRTPAFELAGQIAHDGGVWTLGAERMHVGQSQLAGDFRFDTRPAVGLLTGQLRGRLLQLSDLGPAVGTAGEGSSAAPRKTSGPRILPTREFDLPSLREMNADIAVAIDTLDLGSKGIAPMRQLRTQLKLQDGRLTLDGLRADVAGGQMKGTTVLDGTADVARWEADLRFDGIDVARWLRALHEGDDASAPAYLTGEMVARLNATGRGRSTAQIVGSLNGKALMRLRKGTLSHLAVEAMGLDLAQSLGVMVRGDRALPLNCAVIAMELSDGVMSARRAVVDTSDSTLLMVGNLNLNDEALDLRVTVKPKDFSLLSLRAPVTVTGTLAQPVVGIEAEALAGRAVAAAVLAVLAPPAALLAFMDFGETAAADPCLRDLR